MADSQDKITPSDEAKLAELEKQLSNQKTASTPEKKEPAATATNKKADKTSVKTATKLRLLLLPLTRLMARKQKPLCYGLSP
jgi:uroporphyrin-3 C-methyltransferase